MAMLHVKIFCILGLFLYWTCAALRCHPENDLPELARRKFKRSYQKLREPVVLPGPTSCPKKIFSKLSDTIGNRSISPWTYEEISLPDHFPSTYVQAKCLCSGCIIKIGLNGATYSDNYNSIAVNQSRTFLKRESCNNGTYRLVPRHLDVAVGCTCVRPKSTKNVDVTV